MPNNTSRAPDLEKYLEGRRRNFMTYYEAYKLYDLPYWTFVNLAKEAGVNDGVKM